MKLKNKLIFIFIILSLLISGLLGTSCQAENFDGRLSAITSPHSFNLILWEARVIPRDVVQQALARFNPTLNEVELANEYFAAIQRIRTLNAQIQAANAGGNQNSLAALEAERDTLTARKDALKDTVELIIERQLSEALAEQDIYNSISGLSWLKTNLPPVNFELEAPPHLLVVSPRDRIESSREVVLEQDLSVAEMEAIEDKVDDLGVSSLVVKLGGLGATYPSFVTDEASLRFTLDAAAEEWLHQYLFFRPLGILYTLDLTGISRNYEIAVINETVAGIAASEIGAIIYQKYYAADETDTSPSQADLSGFDFNREMREIRRRVDDLLAQGEIEAAEEFMEERRQFLATQGYHIRKLNQAYFAFYGAYADDPTSISPIGAELRKLREQSGSLKEFLDTAAVLTSRQDLLDILE
jgi:hypothetical protein